MQMVLNDSRGAKVSVAGNCICPGIPLPTMNEPDVDLMTGHPLGQKSCSQEVFSPAVKDSVDLSFPRKTRGIRILSA